MNVLGLDIGGANIKAAWANVDADGVLQELHCHSAGFALWRAPHLLEAKLREVAESQRSFDALAVTMTGELCDCFASRHEGVLHILAAVACLARGRPVGVWSTKAGFVTLEEAASNWIDVASANWHVMAHHMARIYNEGTAIVVDTGSTTTDIVRLEHGELRVTGLTDAKRLSAGELVYTGVGRTPLASLMSEWIGGGERPHRIMAETFATTADIYTLMGDIPEAPTNTDTADGRPMTRRDAANRVLRMVGKDLSIGSMEEAETWARRFALRQVEMIASAIERLAMGNEFVHAVVCGSGAFVAERAVRCGVKKRFELNRYREVLGDAASEAACAVALVALWADPRRGVRGLLEKGIE